jgi:hypothetical protein
VKLTDVGISGNLMSSKKRDGGSGAVAGIPRVGLVPGSLPFPGWGGLAVGDVLTGLGGERYEIRAMLDGGLRIENHDDQFGIQDWGWHALMTLGCNPPVPDTEDSASASRTGTDDLLPAERPASMSVLLTSRFRAALDYAFELHASQRRKGDEPGVPYLGHLLGVCSQVIEDGGSEDEAIAALLHDAVEDAGGQATLDQIRGRFGKRVARIVEHCSDTDVIPKPPWRERKELYIAGLTDRRTTVGTLRVVAADKLHNARAILDDYRRVGDRLWERFATRSAADQLWYYKSVADILVARIPGPLSFELDRTVGLLSWYVACGGIENATSQQPMVWKDGVSGASATGRSGTEWEIAKVSDGRYAITIAHWDRPDYHADTLDDAKQFCDVIDSRPPFWRELTIEDWLPPDA